MAHARRIPRRFHNYCNRVARVFLCGTFASELVAINVSYFYVFLQYSPPVVGRSANTERRLANVPFVIFIDTSRSLRSIFIFQLPTYMHIFLFLCLSRRRWILSSLSSSGTTREHDSPSFSLRDRFLLLLARRRVGCRN